MPAATDWSLILGTALVRLSVIAAILLGPVARWLMPTIPGSGSEAAVGRTLLLTSGAMAVAHALALTRLYEGLLILIILAALIVWRQYYARPVPERDQLVRSYSTLAYEWVDWLTGRRRRRPDPIIKLPPLRVDLRARLREHGPVWLMAAAVLAVSAWMRFDLAFRHAAPAYSDAPVTLVWMKQFGVGSLYPDGVYPMGMYAILSLLKKLTFQSDFLVMSAMGPMVGTLLVVSVFLFVRWATGSTAAGAAGALVYGTLPLLIPGEAARQTGYNSQEFGMLFVLPGSWYAYRYLMTGLPWQSAAAAAAAGAAVMVHPVSGVMAVVYTAAASLAGLLQGAPWRNLVRLVLLSAGASVLALVPPLIGLFVLGKQWHGSSFAFLTEAVLAPLVIPPWPMLAAAALALAAPWVAGRAGRPAWMALILVGAGLLLWVLPVLYPAGPLASLSLRLIESGSLALAVAGGLAWSVGERLLTTLRTPRFLAALCAAGLIGLAWWAYPPQPLEPPRISRDGVIEQFLRIDRNLQQGSWMLVMGETGYALALGRGAHQYPDWFVKNGRVGSTGWCEEADGALVRGQDNLLFIVEEARPDSAPLLEWIARNRSRLPLSQIHAERGLQVWWLSYEPDREAQFDQLWGQGSSACTTSLFPPD